MDKKSPPNQENSQHFPNNFNYHEQGSENHSLQKARKIITTKKIMKMKTIIPKENAKDKNIFSS